MKKIITILCIALAANISSNAQTSGNSSISGEKSKGFILKGKVLPFPMGDYIFTTTVGVEYVFTKHQSLGIDLEYFHQVRHHEYTSSKNKDSIGSNAHFINRGVLVSYRRYFNPENKTLLKLGEKLNAPILPYFSAFARYGKIDNHYNSGYETENIKYDEWQYSVGTVLGAYLGPVDINIGPFYKQHFTSSVDKTSAGATLTNPFYDNWGIRIGFNFLLGHFGGAQSLQSMHFSKL